MTIQTATWLKVHHNCFGPCYNNIRTISVILKKTCFCLANQEEVSIFNFQNQNNIKRIIKATAIKNIKFSPKQNEF